jgi:hypothetical protein
LGLFALLCLYLWPAIFGGQALLPADVLFRDPLWQPQAPVGFSAPSNELMTDQVYQFYPWQVFAQEKLRQGIMPLWNPYQYSGTPFIANDQSSVFYPIKLILSFLPTYLIPGWSALLRLVIACLGTYMLLRVWKASQAASVIAGLTFALGSSIIIMLGHSHTNVTIWLPWLILSADQILSSDHPWPWSLVSSAVIGIQFLGGHAESSFLILVGWALYCLIATLQQHAPLKTIWTRLTLLVLSFILGSALAGIQLAPFLELLPQSSNIMSRAQEAGGQPWFYTGFWKESALAATLFFPNFFGNPTTGDWWIGTGFANYTFVLYMGILPLFLAIAGTRLRRTEWRVKFFAVLGLISLGITFRLPLLDLIRRLPLFNIANLIAFQTIFSLCVAILAGFGLDAVLSSSQPTNQPTKRLARTLTLFASLSGAGLLIIYLALRLLRQEFMNLAQNYVVTYVYGKPPHPYPLEYYLAQLEERYQQIVHAFDPARLTMYLPIVFALGGALVFWLIWKGRLKTGPAKGLILALVIADLWLFGMKLNPTIPPDQLFPWTPALRFLADHQGYDRIASLGSTLPPNTGMPFSLFDVRGYDVSIGRYQILISHLDTAPSGGLILSDHNQNFFNLAGVRYLLSAEPLVSANLQLVYDNEIKIYERLQSLPRVYLTNSYQVITDTSALVAMLDTPDVVTGNQVILEETLPASFPSGQGKSGIARIVSYESNAVTIETDNPQAALLVLSDAFYPGWKVWIDGQESKVYRVNYVFRAVSVPAGQHTVSFSYQPLSFQIGAWTSLSALAVLLSSAGFYGWKWNRKRKAGL